VQEKRSEPASDTTARSRQDQNRNDENGTQQQKKNTTSDPAEGNSPSPENWGRRGTTKPATENWGAARNNKTSNKTGDGRRIKRQQLKAK
jgi:hypothetical protein